MKTAIRDTVRKLLRVAKSTKGPEGALARERALEMMEKHGITIADDNEEYREVVAGVAGTFFREQLLNGIAIALNCKLLRVNRGQGRYEAALAGYASDVAKAKEIYDRLHLDLVVQCRAQFNDFSRQVVYVDDDEEERDSFDPPSPTDILGLDGYIGRTVSKWGRSRRTEVQSRFDDPEGIYEAWQRTFLSTATAEISERLTNGPKKKRIGPTVSPPPGYKDEDEAAMAAEVKRIISDTKRLAGKYSEYGAQEIQRAAVNAGKTAAQNIGRRVQPTDRKLLLANSSFLEPPPPPPKPVEPTRWSELDL